MDLFGALRRISGIIFSKDTYTVTIEPSGTRTKNVTYSIPSDSDTAAADEVLVTEDHAAVLNRKTLETTSTIIRDIIADKSITLSHNTNQPAAGTVVLTAPQASTELVGKTTPTPSLSPDGTEVVTFPVATTTLVGKNEITPDGGIAGQILKHDGSKFAPATPIAITWDIGSITHATTQVYTRNNEYPFDGVITVTAGTLPTAPAQGSRIRFIDAGQDWASSSVIISAGGADTIYDGIDTTVILNVLNGNLELVYYGTNWNVVSA